jgi:hypothetical protein
LSDPHEEQTSILGKGFTPQVARPAERVASAYFAQMRAPECRSAACPLRTIRRSGGLLASRFAFGVEAIVDLSPASLPGTLLARIAVT